MVGAVKIDDVVELRGVVAEDGDGDTGLLCDVAFVAGTGDVPV
jgi:hypothetical protein